MPFFFISKIENSIKTNIKTNKTVSKLILKQISRLRTYIKYSIITKRLIEV